MSSWTPSISILMPHQSMGAAVGGTLYTDFLPMSLQLYVVVGSGDSGDVEMQTNPIGRGLPTPPS